MLADRIDGVMGWLKWPVAVLSLLSLPLWVWSFALLCWEILQAPYRIVPFALGVAAFVMLWKSWFEKRALGNWAIQFEHEVTHLLFAWLTMHRVVGFRASLAKGSHVKIMGKGNWLITSAPYFFPTLAIILWVISWLLPIPFLPWASLVLGFAFGYHIISTWRETHVDQEDLKLLSWNFCWLFLPTANLIMLSCMLAYSFGGAEEVLQFFQRVFGFWQSIPNASSSVASH